jgi:hypothetical protein
MDTSHIFCNSLKMIARMYCSDSAGQSVRFIADHNKDTAKLSYGR